MPSFITAPKSSPWLTGVCIAPLLLTACGGSGSREEPVDYGLNDDWTARVQDQTLASATWLMTVDGEDITRIFINGHDSGDIGLIWQQAQQVYGVNLFPRPPEPVEPEEGEGELPDLDDLPDLPDDLPEPPLPEEPEEEPEIPILHGRLITSTDQSTLMLITPEYDAGVFQRGELNISDATLLELQGHWRGPMIGNLFDTEGGLYRHEFHIDCAIGTCVMTAWHTAMHDDGRYAILHDTHGNPVRDSAGMQITLSGIEPRGRLFFDLDFTNTLGHAGTGVLMMSPDRNWIGTYLCRPDTPMEACDFGLFERQD